MRTAVGLSLLWCVQAEQASIYINAGGVSYIDSSGIKWSADKYYNKGETFNELYWIFDTNDRNLYRSNRYDAGDSEPHLTYEIPVENGSYEVKLHFAETYSGALSIGARVFDVDIEKLVAFPSLDIFDEAGGYTALIKETTAQVTDGSLTIEFIRQKEMPLVSAIEIHQLDATVQKAEDSPEGADGESPIPSAVPSFEPSTVPSSQPSPRPSAKKNKKKREKEGAEKVTGSQSQASAPTPTPSSFPSTLPSSVPSSLPSFKPSGMPSLSESEIPSALPTISLSFSPSGNPTSEVDRPLLTVKMSKPSSLPSREPSKRPSEAQSFGVQKLVLVNANLNKDLEGALDCIPINACTGSSLTEFNIRAEVFGDVDRVHFTLEGPITETHTDRRVPYSVFSDDGEGDYNGEELLQGNYTITATALNSDNESSDPYVKVFTVSSQDGFGITDLVFVDADTNEDIDGAMDCDPVDSCFGSASSVGMRAKVHGDVRSVFFTTEGPITQSRTESRAPWSVFGDIGDAIRGKEMVPGSYTVTARATNDDGDESDLFTRSFVVGSQSSSPRPSKKPASPPSLEPSWTPTELVEDAGSAVPSFDPSRSPSIVPSVSPSIEPSSTPSFLAEQGFKPIYINCGGSSFEDARGIIWEADKYFLSGAKSATSESIEGAVDSKLFQTERWDSSVSKRLAYEIPVPEGYRYRVSLLFSENYERLQKVGGRVFSVKLESDIVFSDLDIFAEAGGPFTALNKTATTFVSDGSLSIAFINNVQSPKVSGIEVHQLPETLSPVALGAGKPDSINMPSLAPSGEPSELPSGLPSNPPSVLPAEALSTESSSSGLPSQDPSATPSQLPSGQPSWDPMGKPSEGPSRVPVGIPTTIAPTRSPTLSPSQFPSTLPSLLPSGTPSGAPSKSPVVIPTTTAPTPQPTASPTPDPSSSPSGTPTLSPFGVNGFILVDADSGSDIEGALECSPASSCFGSASNFNIRATVFGSDVQGVELLLEGPVAEATIEKVAPYSIFGDKDGTFFGKALPVGAYTIRAFAFNSQGDVSNDYSLTFDVLETPSVSPSGQPSLIPTFRPTNSPTPAPIAPVVAPTTADPSSVPSSMPSSSPFGVDGFVLVDADRNQDIVDALMECDPIDDCVGSASKFNIRATVFGNSIKGVDITIVGPVKGTKREEVPPYAVFGDKNGDYNGTALPPGQYSITARAFNEEGKFSQNYTVTFNVANAPTQPPSGRPSQVPTPVPTGMPSPAPILPAPDPTASSTPSPTPKRTSFPSSAPTKLPTSRPTLSPSAQPYSSPTDTPSKGPTLAPITPVADPTLDPTSAPTPVPSHSPTEGPTGSPTESPTVVPLPQPTPSPTEDAVEQLQNPIRINAGGKAFTDSQGVEWASDAFFQGGKTYETTMPIVNTDKQELYRSERYSDSTTPGGLIYDIPVPNGSYLVSLHFAGTFI
jgi:insulin receptor substrate 1